MKHPWKELLENLNLDRRDRDTVRRFLQNPQGTHFLPVVSLLQAQAHPEEAFELLNWGVTQHPQYLAARVTLAKELYERGLVHDCRLTLLGSAKLLRENVLAQKLLFKTALLCQDYADLPSATEQLQKNNMLDPSIEALIRTLHSKGPGYAALQLQEEFRQKGLALILPANVPAASAAPSSPLHELASPPALRRGPLSTLASFYAVPLEEVFGQRQSSPCLQRTRSGEQLEGRTLADIYRKQGLYGEALTVYQNLLQRRPHDATLQQQFAATQKECQSQQQNSLTHNRDLTDNSDSEHNRELCAKIAFYRDLLDKLKHDPSSP